MSARRSRPSAFGALAAMAVVCTAASASSAPAAAPTKGQCVDADTQAQSLQRERRLGAARAQLLVCVDAACPKMVRDDCSQRLDDLERAQPTIVLVAQDASGGDLTAVTVTVDGKPLVSKLDGTAVAMDPGEHDVTFEVAGRTPVTKHIVVHEGEKARREAIVIGTRPPPETAPPFVAPAPPAAAPPPAPSSPPQEPIDAHPSRGGGQRIAGIVVGAAGIVGVGVGAIFGATASSDFSQQKSACASPGCSPASHALALSDHSDATSAATIATVGFLAGGALLAGGIVLFFTAPKGEPGPAVSLVPSIGPGSGAMWLRGTF